MITYIHEVAHLVTFEEFQAKVKPHGMEWRENFRNLIQPLIRNHVFPDNLLPVIPVIELSINIMFVAPVQVNPDTLESQQL